MTNEYPLLLILGKDSCSGDSGGPLFLRNGGSEEPWFQIGVVSFGGKVCGDGLPGVYTKVTEFLDWIGSEMKE
jgi:secreted trypsin-like serine protease